MKFHFSQSKIGISGQIFEPLGELTLYQPNKQAAHTCRGNSIMATCHFNLRVSICRLYFDRKPTGETKNPSLSERVPRFSVRASIIPGPDSLDVSSFIQLIYVYRPILVET